MTDHAPLPGDHIPGILAVIATLAVVVEMALVHVFAVPKENETLVTQIQTGLIGGWMVAMTYYFGTTANRKRDADTIATQAQTIQTANAALAPVAGAPNAADTIPIAPGEVRTVVGTDAPPTEGNTP